MIPLLLIAVGVLLVPVAAAVGMSYELGEKLLIPLVAFDVVLIGSGAIWGAVILVRSGWTGFAK